MKISKSDRIQSKLFFHLTVHMHVLVGVMDRYSFGILAVAKLKKCSIKNIRKWTYFDKSRLTQTLEFLTDPMLIDFLVVWNKFSSYKEGIVRCFICSLLINENKRLARIFPISFRLILGPWLMQWLGILMDDMWLRVRNKDEQFYGENNVIWNISTALFIFSFFFFCLFFLLPIL